MKVVTLDFETYYDREYSLSKMTTEEYIRDPRFEVLMMAAQVDDDEPTVVEGPDISDFLASLDLTDKAVCAHNVVFDGAILAFRYGVYPKAYLDTMSMARPKHAKTTGCSLAALAKHYGLEEKGTEVVTALGKRRADFTDDDWAAYKGYCAKDVRICRALFKTLMQDFPSTELRTIDTTIRMYTDPMIRLNRPLLQRHYEEELERKKNLVSMMHLPEGTTEEDAKAIIMSNDKFAEYLSSLGVEPPTKVSARTGKQAWAFSKTDQDFKALLEHPDEKVVAAVEARLGVKTTIEETRTARLLDAETRGALPLMLNYYGAHTGRFCLTGDTHILVLRNGRAEDILLKELCNTDLVWDGEAFVEHDGLAYQGVAPVMAYQGVTGTLDHRVYVDEKDEAVTLFEASNRGYTISVARSPECARLFVSLADTDYGCYE